MKDLERLRCTFTEIPGPKERELVELGLQRLSLLEFFDFKKADRPPIRFSSENGIFIFGNDKKKIVSK